MNRTWKNYAQWALSVLLIAIGIYCAYMSYSLRADAAQPPKPASIVCVPKDKAAIGLLTPATRAAWKTERAAKAKAAKAREPKAERGKVKR